MKKLLSGILPVTLILLTSCGAVGDKSASMSIIYGVTAIISLLLLIGYCVFIKKREAWFLLLFASVFVVNTGYFTLSISHTLEEALLANRISYLGSVFLPFSMVMTIFNLSEMKIKKWITGVLIGITIIVFLIAASPGYLDIYYKSVTLETSNGMSVLKKEYGPWHSVYLYYLLSYFGLMIGTTLHAVTEKKIKSGIQSAIIIIAVFVNICVWLLEQFVAVNFEFLSVSYIISELFLIALYLMIQEQENKQASPAETVSNIAQTSSKDTGKSTEFEEKFRYITDHVPTLTPTEKSIFDLYIAGKGTKDVLSELDITENTLKFHNKNIYSKLGVSSRKQLLEYLAAEHHEN